MSVKIKAKLLRVNKYSKGVFAIENNDKLIDAASKALGINLRTNELLDDPVEYKLPFTDREFTASVVKETAEHAIGSICYVTLCVRKYEFTSKLKANKGDTVTGVSLTVKNITDLA